jgi:predicted lactoylglutathione lyase
MAMKLPKAVPEIPVSNVETAAAYYVDRLGFTFGWGDDKGGIGGIFNGECRLFLTNAEFRKWNGTSGPPIVIWLNMESKAEVDEVFRQWRDAGAKILSEPEDKPYLLREFRAADLDGNQIRVFYDFHWDVEPGKSEQKSKG